MLFLEKLLFYLLVFCLPFQIRLILAQFSLSFNEWQTVFIYLTDFFVVALLILWLKRTGGRVRQFYLIEVLVVLFLGISFLSLFDALSFGVGFYRWLKLVEFVFLFLYLRVSFLSVLNLRYFSWAWVGAALSQSFLALGQFVRQTSLGFSFLGESYLNLDIAGVANFLVAGEKIMRAYGTLPHPNVLATFLGVGLFFLFFLFITKKDDSFLSDFIYFTLTGFLLGGLWVTFSRSVLMVIGITFMFCLIWLSKESRRKVLFYASFLFVWLLFWFLIFQEETLARFTFSLKDQAVVLRLAYQDIAFSFIDSFPFFGVGLGNFVFQIKATYSGLADWLYQPVHNIYLLLASEVGLIGFCFFCYFILLVLIQSFRRAYKEKRRIFLKIITCLLLSFVLIGFFDHFFFTLQSGQLMWWLVLGVLSGQAGRN